jgi:hypothetical protein
MLGLHPSSLLRGCNEIFTSAFCSYHSWAFVLPLLFTLIFCAAIFS